MPHLSRRQFLISASFPAGSASFPAGSAFEANLPLGQNKTLSQRNVGVGQVLVDTEDFVLINDANWASPPPVLPEARRVKGGPTQELCRTIRGGGEEPVSNFVDHDGPPIGMVLPGHFAVHLGRKIDRDMESMDAFGLPEVKAMHRRVYRAGWDRSRTDPSPEWQSANYIAEVAPHAPSAPGKNP